jgi:hypothetical protein
MNHDDSFTFFDLALSSVQVLVAGIILSLCIKLVCPYTVLFAIDVGDEDVGHCVMCYAYHTRTP